MLITSQGTMGEACSQSVSTVIDFDPAVTGVRPSTHTRDKHTCNAQAPMLQQLINQARRACWQRPLVAHFSLIDRAQSLHTHSSPPTPAKHTATPSSTSAATPAGVQHYRRIPAREPARPLIVVTAGADHQTQEHSDSMSLNKRIGFLGAGQMAEALARGLMAKGVLSPDKMCCSDPNQDRMDLFKSLGIASYASNMEVVKNADVLFVAVKPQYVSVVLKEAQPLLGDNHTIVSIAAGVTLEKMVEAAGSKARIVRVMPNTPCLVGETAAAMSLGGKADADDEALVRKLFEAVGKIYTVDEKLLAAVTGLSGSGPAYVFIMIEALADGGVHAGLPRDIAMSLAAQTVLGSARMVLEAGKHPGQLKDNVTSPGGTTIAGVRELENAGVRAALMNAVISATNRANELSKM